MPAPYSDNLYSAADSSDDEAEALSPTDGYFHASSPQTASSSHPFHHSIPNRSNVLVEDPTLADPAAKAREAEAERAQSNRDDVDLEAGTFIPSRYQPPSVSHSQSSYNHRRSVEEEHHHSHSPSIDEVVSSHSGHTRRPLVTHHRDAPPAYTPSATSPITGYHTFGPSNSTMGLPPDQQRLIPRGPESMGDPLGSQPSRWQRCKDFVASLELRKRIKKILGVLVILSIFVMLLSSITLRPNHKDPDPPLGDNAPVKKPNMDHSDLKWKPITGCHNGDMKQYRSSMSLQMSYTHNLSFTQTIADDEQGKTGWSPHVSGDVILRPTESGSPGIVDFEIITNGQNLDVVVDVDRKTQTFKITTPRRVDWDSSHQGPCIQIRATIWAPRDAFLNSLDIKTVHLDISIQEGFILGVINPVTLHSTIGDIKTPTAKKTTEQKDAVVPYTLATREIFIYSVSGVIKGWYPLYDILDLKTESGDITVEVEPKSASPEGVRPASLRARSLSGDLSIQEPIDAGAAAERPDKRFPPREYQVEMNTASGDISADVAFSSNAHFSSQSGDLTLRMWPVLDSAILKDDGDATEPSFKTNTKSGKSNIIVLKPLWTSMAIIGEVIPPLTPDDLDSDNEPYIIHPKNGKPLDPFIILDAPSLAILASTHESISGDIKLRYPSSWEGTLRATSISGSLDIRGDGLEITRDSDRPWRKNIMGRKGTGHSELTIESVSGDQDVLVGEVVGKEDKE